MDTTLKQRILGIIVLMALLGICLTVLLHNNKTARLRERSTIVSITPQIETTNAALLDTNASTNSPTTTPTNNLNTPNTPNSQNTQSPSTQSVFNPAAGQSNANASTSAPAPTTTAPITASPASATPSSSATQSQSLNTMQAVLVSKSAKPANLIAPQNTTQKNQITTSAQTITTKPAPASKVAALPPASFANNNVPSTPTTSYANNNEEPTPIVIGNDGNVITSPASPSNENDVTAATPAKTHQHKITTAPTAEPITTHKNTSIINHNTSSATAANGETGLVVQVGSFSLSANAESLVDQLHAKGFVATAQKFQTAKGEMTRVIVGTPGLNHADAEALRSKLQNEVKLQGIIVSHEPRSATKTTSNTVNKKPKQAVKVAENTTPITDEI